MRLTFLFVCEFLGEFIATQVFAPKIVSCNSILFEQFKRVFFIGECDITLKIVKVVEVESIITRFLFNFVAKLSCFDKFIECLLSLTVLINSHDVFIYFMLVFIRTIRYFFTVVLRSEVFQHFCCLHKVVKYVNSGI